MRVLPREHGATVIWLSSLVLALGTLREAPGVVGLVAFVVASALALVLLAQLTSRSVAVMRMERDPILLPTLSGALTLVVPLGHLAMVGRLPAEVLAVWLLFLTYTVAGVFITRIGVRAILRRTTPALSGSILLASVALGAEAILLSAFGSLRIEAAAVLAPLFAYWRAIEYLSRSKVVARAGIVRSVGFAHSADTLAAVAILVVVLPL